MDLKCFHEGSRLDAENFQFHKQCLQQQTNHASHLLYSSSRYNLHLGLFISPVAKHHNIEHLDPTEHQPRLQALLPLETQTHRKLEEQEQDLPRPQIHAGVVREEQSEKRQRDAS
jgi:hypothetical protein